MLYGPCGVCVTEWAYLSHAHDSRKEKKYSVCKVTCAAPVLPLSTWTRQQGFSIIKPKEISKINQWKFRNLSTRIPWRQLNNSTFVQNMMKVLPISPHISHNDEFISVKFPVIPFPLHKLIIWVLSGWQVLTHQLFIRLVGIRLPTLNPTTLSTYNNTVVAYTSMWINR